MGIVVGGINSYTGFHFDHALPSRVGEPPVGKTGGIGVNSTDRTQRARSSEGDASGIGQGLSPKPVFSDHTVKQDAKILELKKRDAEVRAHEQAHISAGGQYVRGGAKYAYTTGPDGLEYAVSGEVSIDVTSIPDDPQGTIQKMQVVKRAALAPSQPSPQDRQVASAADRATIQAQLDLVRKVREQCERPALNGRSGKGTKIDTFV